MPNYIYTQQLTYQTLYNLENLKQTFIPTKHQYIYMDTNTGALYQLIEIQIPKDIYVLIDHYTYKQLYLQNQDQNLKPTRL